MVETKTIEEPKDLFEFRKATHELIGQLYEYLRFTEHLAEFGRTFSFDEVEGLNPFELREWALSNDLFEGDDANDPISIDDPIELQLQNAEIASQVLAVLGHKHQQFLSILTPLEDELARLTIGAETISGFSGRSCSKALEIFVFHIIRETLNMMNESTLASERFPGQLPDDIHPFTLSNWHPTCEHVSAIFNKTDPQIDLEDIVHEFVEEELDLLWRIRMEESEDSISEPEANDPQHTPNVSVTQFAGRSEPVDTNEQSGPNNKGISLMDAARYLSEFDEEAAKETRDRWQRSNRKDISLPKSIGYDPNHSQRKLFAPFALSEFCEKSENLSDEVKRQLHKHLRNLARNTIEESRKN